MNLKICGVPCFSVLCKFFGSLSVSAKWLINFPWKSQTKLVNRFFWFRIPKNWYDEFLRSPIVHDSVHKKIWFFAQNTSGEVSCLRKSVEYWRKVEVRKARSLKSIQTILLRCSSALPKEKSSKWAQYLTKQKFVLWTKLGFFNQISAGERDLSYLVLRVQ